MDVSVFEEKECNVLSWFTVHHITVLILKGH